MLGTVLSPLQASSHSILQPTDEEGVRVEPISQTEPLRAEEGRYFAQGQARVVGVRTAHRALLLGSGIALDE